jgi:hypothetical protein
LEDDEKAVKDGPESACGLVGDGASLEVVAFYEIGVGVGGIVGHHKRCGAALDRFDVVDHCNDRRSEDEEERKDAEEPNGIEGNEKDSFLVEHDDEDVVCSWACRLDWRNVTKNLLQAAVGINMKKENEKRMQASSWLLELTRQGGVERKARRRLISFK